MKKILLIIQFLVITLFLFANPVTNVRAIQEGKKIVVLYDLSGDTYISQILIEVDGKSRVIPNKFLKGDVDKDLKVGADKRVEYDVLADYVDGFKSDNVVFEVQISKYKAVDLGLSVKWATCNVGAEKPEEYGDYFAWGEVKPKEYYDWSTYKYCRGTGETMTKYCTQSGYGIVDNNTMLDPEDDVATVNWGGAWRMPTKAEQDELREKCKWTWTTQNGVNGYKVVGLNGNSIFLPAAGYMGRSSLNGVGSRGVGSLGYYWSSSLGTSYPDDAYRVHFSSSYVDGYGSGRYTGQSVRPVCPKKQEHEWVDLGLSVKWATCNVGATKPEEYGDYFAWGEVKPKEYYDWSTYKYCRGSYDSMTKYCNNSSYGNNGFTDNKTILDPEDDAATVNWGGAWRMPTKAEQDELREKCKWTWTTQNGVNGYKVVGLNGNSIFLPAAGFMDTSSLYDVGSGGYYLSSSLNTGYPYSAYDVDFISNYVGRTDYGRYGGQSVRPVCK